MATLNVIKQSAQNLLIPFSVDGCDRLVFETWVETFFLPVLQLGQVVILDNVIKQAGAKAYLPPYSPNLNKIEHCRSWLKSRICKHLALFECLRDAIEYVLP